MNLGNIEKYFRERRRISLLEIFNSSNSPCQDHFGRLHKKWDWHQHYTSTSGVGINLTLSTHLKAGSLTERMPAAPEVPQQSPMQGLSWLNVPQHKYSNGKWWVYLTWQDHWLMKKELALTRNFDVKSFNSDHFRNGESGTGRIGWVVGPRLVEVVISGERVRCRVPDFRSTRLALSAKQKLKPRLLAKLCKSRWAQWPSGCSWEKTMKTKKIPGSHPPRANLK